MNQLHGCASVAEQIILSIPRRRRDPRGDLRDRAPTACWLESRTHAGPRRRVRIDRRHTQRRRGGRQPKLAEGATVFCGVFVQALPFLVLGVVVSGLVAAFVTPERLARWLPRRGGAAVLVAGVGGAALPGCECGSVPVARRVVRRHVPGAAALTFMLSAPAINPVVLVATSVAFPGEPRMVLARLIGSLLTAVAMGAFWLRWGRASWITRHLPKMHDQQRFPVDGLHRGGTARFSHRRLVSGARCSGCGSVTSFAAAMGV